MRYLLTYYECKLLCQRYNNFNFSERIYEVEGYKVSVFNYFLCDFNHFDYPIKENINLKAFDVRGITFVFNSDGSLFARYFMLPKFFNLNQVENTQYDKVKNKVISNINVKEDGSLIAFMKLPNGNIFCKTIGGIGNEQSIEARKIYDADTKLQEFISKCLDNNYTPLFEYVAFSNRIVIVYNKPQLRFLGLRSNVDGSYISNGKLKIDNIPSAKSFVNLSLDDLIKQSKTIQDIEGWVVEFEDGQLIKIKGEHYLKMHSLRTENVFREDYIIKHYLEGTIDDIVCQLDTIIDADALAFIEKVKASVKNWIAKIDKDVNDLMLLYKNDVKQFAIDNHKNYAFTFCMNIIKGEDYNKAKIDYMLRKSYRLQEAKFLIEKYK